jgi:uncharacterized protein YjbI with pentapeptide repeats
VSGCDARSVRWTAAALALAAAASFAGPARAAGGTPSRAAPIGRCTRIAAEPAQQVVARLRRGKPVVLSCVRIRDRLDLTPLATIPEPFKCRGCRLENGLAASDVVFARTLDLSGSRIKGPVDLEGASFQGPVLFASAPRPAEFQGDVDASLAVFGDLASFEQTVFKGRADFGLARFRGETSFAGARFEGTSRPAASFRAAVFDGPVVLDHADFAGAADFTRSSFGSAGFRAVRFLQPAARAGFTEAIFRGDADFSQGIFLGGASFPRAQFLQHAAFVGTQFFGDLRHEAASFVNVGAAGDVDFSFADFRALVPAKGSARKERPLIASFFRLVVAGTLSFSNAEFQSGYALAMNELSARNLVLDVEKSPLVDDDPGNSANQQQVLESIESSSKERDDLVTANDADYRLHVLRSRTYSWPWRVLDLVFYRWIAGYLVRPLRPLLTFLALALLLSAIRIAVGRPLAATDGAAAEPKPGPPRRRGRWRRLGRGFVAHVNDFLDTLTLIGPQRWSAAGGGQRLELRLESVVYRVLFACALIGLANSNPTLRQLVDALV